MSNHLHENNISYYQHMKFSLGYAKESCIAMFCFFIHAFFPDYLIVSGSEKIKYLNALINNRKSK